MAMMKIDIKAYPPEAETLVKIWNTYVKHGMGQHGIEYITFTHLRPKKPRGDKRRIAGLPAESLYYLRDNEELVKMSVENYIYLMAKAGVDIEVKEVQDE